MKIQIPGVNRIFAISKEELEKAIKEERYEDARIICDIMNDDFKAPYAIKGECSNDGIWSIIKNI